MKRLLAVLSLLAVSFNTAAQDPAPPAFRLGDAAVPRAYDLRLAIDPRDSAFQGEVRIALRVQRAVPVLWLNAHELEIGEAVFRFGERSVRARVIPTPQDFVGFAIDGGFPEGDAVAEIRYAGKMEPVATRGLFRQREAGEWYAITQFEAINARRAIPSFDEPGWKTPWRVTVDAPASEQVLSNMPVESAAPLPDRAGWKRHVFAETPPLPTYLVAIAVGPFDIVDGGTGGAKATPLRYAVPKGRAADARYATQVTPRLLAHLEEYFGGPYPFAKLDSATIPATVGFGAMENVGLITYSAELLAAPPRRETLAFQRRYVAIASHEMAHQWFGDLVTLAWWDDVWLNESFATWMARKNLRAFHRDWEGGWRAGDQRRRALGADRLMTARRVANPVTAKNDIYGSFDGITYAKGGEVLSMFEAWLGPERFRAGVRKFLADHAFGNATSTDFFRALGEASGRGEAAVAAFRTFIEQPGIPLVDAKLQCKAGKATLEVDQKRLVPRGATPGGETRWTTPACFRYSVGGKLFKQCAEVTGKQSIALAEARRCPDWVLGNADGAGHWLARLDPALRQRALRHVAQWPEAEAVAVATDTELLFGSGLMDLDEALRTAEALFHHPALGAKHGAVHILAGIRPEWLGGAAKARYEEIERRFLQPLAREVSWHESHHETLARQDLRGVLLPLAARLPGGEALRHEARSRALRWLGDRRYLPESTVPAVLATAARFADGATITRMEHSLVNSRDRRDRAEILSALATVRDPALRERVQALMLLRHGADETLDGREVAMYLDKALLDEHNGPASFAWLRRNWDALLAKLPADSTARLLRATRALCTAAERDAVKAFFAERAPQALGGPRAYEQTLENIEQCIAAHGG